MSKVFDAEKAKVGAKAQENENETSELGDGDPDVDIAVAVAVDVAAPPLLRLDGGRSLMVRVGAVGHVLRGLVKEIDEWLEETA